MCIMLDYNIYMSVYVVPNPSEQMSSGKKMSIIHLTMNESM